MSHTLASLARAREDVGHDAVLPKAATQLWHIDPTFTQVLDGGVD